MKRCEVTGKKKYRNQEDAMAAALRNSERFGATLRAYECRSCDHWHLTTKPKHGNASPRAMYGGTS